MNDYRSLPRIDNSDLAEFKNQLFGKQDHKASPEQKFGIRFHNLLPLEIDVVPTGEEATAQNQLTQWYVSLLLCVLT